MFFRMTLKVANLVVGNNIAKVCYNKINLGEESLLRACSVANYISANKKLFTMGRLNKRIVCQTTFCVYQRE